MIFFSFPLDFALKSQRSVRLAQRVLLRHTAGRSTACTLNLDTRHTPPPIHLPVRFSNNPAYWTDEGAIHRCRP